MLGQKRFNCTDNNVIVSSVFVRLASVSQLSVTVTNQGVDEGDVNFTGNGLVKVERLDQRTVIWHESGCWDKTLNQLEFSNCYRWSLLGNGQIKLEHLRYGKENPIELVNCQQIKETIWQSITPHYCGSDTYQMSLSVLLDSIELAWTITGPKKDQRSVISYR